MARSPTTNRKATATKIRSTSPSTKRPGRPKGSKNKAIPVSATRANRKTLAPVPRRPAVKAARSTIASRRVAPAKKTAAAPKMNKADLEAHIAKLERTIVRLRDQMKELKASGASTDAKTTVAKKPIRGRKSTEPEVSATLKRAARKPLPRRSKAQEASLEKDDDKHDGSES
jgi:hypothetical protein